MQRLQAVQLDTCLIVNCVWYGYGYIISTGGRLLPHSERQFSGTIGIGVTVEAC